jgi:hypothetical protein
MNIKTNIDFIDKLLLCSSEMNIYINNYYNNINIKKNIKRRKTNLNDGFLFKLLNTQLNSTQETVTAKLNTYNKQNISRTSYSDRANQLDLKFFSDIYKKFSNLIDKIFYNKNDNNMNIIAVDGTYCQFKSSITNNQNLNKNNSSIDFEEV